jgi:hypothetical protein
MTMDEPIGWLQCGAATRITERFWLGGTAGPRRRPVDLGGLPAARSMHVKTGCQRGHWFTPTVDPLDLRPAPTAGQPLPVPVD